MSFFPHADSTNADNFSHPLGILVDTCYGNDQSTVTLPGEVQAAGPIAPCPMEMLDSLTVHAKMRYAKGCQCKLTTSQASIYFRHVYLHKE